MLRLLLLLSLLYSFVAIAQKNAGKKYLKAGWESRMVYLDSGMVQLRYMGGDQDVPLNALAEPGEFKVGAFYMGAYEVCNFDYLEYLYWLSREKYEKYAPALPDTTVWTTKRMYNQGYLEYYLRHPAYRYYPLVGVTHQQALDYCAWLTDRYNEYPERKHKKVRLSPADKKRMVVRRAFGGRIPRTRKRKSNADRIPRLRITVSVGIQNSRNQPLFHAG